MIFGLQDVIPDSVENTSPPKDKLHLQKDRYLKGIWPEMDVHPKVRQAQLC